MYSATEIFTPRSLHVLVDKDHRTLLKGKFRRVKVFTFISLETRGENNFEAMTNITR